MNLAPQNPTNQTKPNFLWVNKSKYHFIEDKRKVKGNIRKRVKGRNVISPKKLAF